MGSAIGDANSIKDDTTLNLVTLFLVTFEFTSNLHVSQESHFTKYLLSKQSGDNINGKPLSPEMLTE